MYENFPNETSEKQIIVLDIPDEYKFMDSDLIEEIETKVSQYV